MRALANRRFLQVRARDKNSIGSASDLHTVSFPFHVSPAVHGFGRCGHCSQLSAIVEERSIPSEVNTRPHRIAFRSLPQIHECAVIRPRLWCVAPADCYHPSGAFRTLGGYCAPSRNESNEAREEGDNNQCCWSMHWVRLKITKSSTVAREESWQGRRAAPTEVNVHGSHRRR